MNNQTSTRRKVLPARLAEKSLYLDWCDYAAAKYACEHWHYSGVPPAGKLIKIGVWEEKHFIGCILFGRGANNHIGRPYSLSQTQCCELVRIALKNHHAPVTKMVSRAIKMIKNHNPGLELIVSFADPAQGHLGKIYQAGNWLYVGKSQAQREVIVDGKVMHKRTANSKFGTIKGLEKSEVLWKYKYLMPLNKAMKKQIQPLAKPYPHAAKA